MTEKSLKDTISLVRDSQTDDVEIEGILIAANFKARAFIIQSGDESIHGRFRENIIPPATARKSRRTTAST